MVVVVDEIVCKQVVVGVDIVSDGEILKILYVIYVKDCYMGFDGDSLCNVFVDFK